GLDGQGLRGHARREPAGAGLTDDGGGRREGGDERRPVASHGGRRRAVAHRPVLDGRHAGLGGRDDPGRPAAVRRHPAARRRRPPAAGLVSPPPRGGPPGGAERGTPPPVTSSLIQSAPCFTSSRTARRASRAPQITLAWGTSTS